METSTYRNTSSNQVRAPRKSFHRWPHRTPVQDLHASNKSRPRQHDTVQPDRLLPTANTGSVRCCCCRTAQRRKPCAFLADPPYYRITERGCARARALETRGSVAEDQATWTYFNWKHRHRLHSLLIYSQAALALPACRYESHTQQSKRKPPMMIARRLRPPMGMNASGVVRCGSTLLGAQAPTRYRQGRWPVKRR